MAITLQVTPEVEQQLREQAAQTGKTPEQTAMDALIAGLRDRKTPQTLADLERRPLPPGKTLGDLFAEFYRDFPDDGLDNGASEGDIISPSKMSLP